MSSPEQPPTPRPNPARAPSVETLKAKVAMPVNPSDVDAPEDVPAAEATAPEAPAEESTLQEDLKNLPAASRREDLVPPPPAQAPDGDRPVMVLDEFVLAEADPVSEERRMAARAERQRRRALRAAAAKRRRRRRFALGVIATVLLLVLAFVGWLRWTTGGLDRIPGALSAAPAAAAAPGTTILLVGSDPGAHDEVTTDSSWKRSLGHSDLVMLLHIPAQGGQLYGISLPGRMHYRLPGGRRGEIGSLMAHGGQAAYVRTVEAATGVHVDHLAVLNLAGLQSVIDDLDGITVQMNTPGCGEQVGPRTLDGEGALELIRYRKCLKNGDLDRVARQQDVLKAVLSTLVGDALPNPFKLNRIAKDTFDNLAVDQHWSLLDMAGTAWSERSITPHATSFLTAPTVRGKGGYLELSGRARELWDALRADKLDEYVALNRGLVS